MHGGNSGLTGYMRTDEFPGHHVQTDFSLDQTVRQDDRTRKMTEALSFKSNANRDQDILTRKPNSAVRLSPLQVNLQEKLALSPRVLKSPRISSLHARNRWRTNGGKQIDIVDDSYTKNILNGQYRSPRQQSMDNTPRRRGQRAQYRVRASKPSMQSKSVKKSTDHRRNLPNYKSKIKRSSDRFKRQQKLRRQQNRAMVRSLHSTFFFRREIA